MTRYFEDIEPGLTRDCGELEVTETRSGDDPAFGHTETEVRTTDDDGDLVLSMVGLGLVEKRGDGS
jgi:diacylglycerol kinase family enzyme